MLIITHYGALLPLTDVNPASVQAFHGDVEPLSLLTEPVGHRHGTVLKYHRSRRLRIPSHLEDGRTRSRQTLKRCCHLVVGNETTLEGKTYHLFFFFAKVEPRRSLLHHQTRDALRPFASCSAHHDVDVGVSSSTDEGLREDEGEENTLTLDYQPVVSLNGFMVTLEPFRM